jgi:hypothetical protein
MWQGQAGLGKGFVGPQNCNLDIEVVVSTLGLQDQKYQVSSVIPHPPSIVILTFSH